MSGFVNTFQLVQDKLESIVRTEFQGYSVFFDDEYMNRKNKYFNIKKGGDTLVTNLIPSAQIRNYSFEIKFYSKKTNLNDQHNTQEKFRIGDRLSQLIKNNQNVDFHSFSVDGSTRNLNFIDGVFSNYDSNPDREDSEDIDDLDVLSFDYSVNIFESLK